MSGCRFSALPSTEKSEAPYFGVFKQIPVVTIELPNATTMPSQKDQQEMWQDMLKWIKNDKR